MKENILEDHYLLTKFLVEKVKANDRWAVEQAKEKTLRESRARDIQFKLIAINALFNKITNQEFFKMDVPGFFTELPISCKDYRDFKDKIENLCCIFEVELSGLRSLIPDPDSNWKSRKILKEWLKTKGISDYTKTIAVWDKICFLRSMPPTRPKMTSDHVEIMEFFGGDVANLPQLWENILECFLNSLNKFYDILKMLQ